MQRELLLGVALAVLSLSTAARASSPDQWLEYDGGAEQLFEGGLGGGGPVPVGANVLGGGSALGPYGASIALAFQGVSQYDAAAFGRNFIPPDTMGAVGASQYMETTNGAYAIYDKVTGAQLSKISDVNFWAAAGQVGANGDSRVQFDAAAQKWVVMSFGASVGDLQIATSDTSNALGPWHSTKFTSYTGIGFGGAVADYPTLAMDSNNLYIGTNNYASSSAGAGSTFHGTSMDIIPLSSITAAGGPTITGGVQYNTYYNTPGHPTDLTYGFALQGVNGHVGADAKVMSVSQTSNALETFNISNPTDAATGAYGPATFLGSGYNDVTPAGQPGSAGVGMPLQNIDALDDRISSSVWEVNGRVYSVHTVGGAAGNDVVRITVIDAKTNAVLSETNVGQDGYDFYQGSIGVNKDGELVLGYNKSGTSADGLIKVMARTFNTNADGSLTQLGGETLLITSLVPDYHNGSIDGQPPAGRQRWGDYSSVTVDPNDPQSFWVIGEYAREYNDAAGGHPGGTGGSRWSTFIADINVAAVPEPSAWAMMLVGFGLIGGAARRRARTAVV